MQRGNISVQTENIFPIIKKFLYSDQEIFLRELIANATDATSKLLTLSGRGETVGQLEDLSIEVILDSEAKTLTIRDKGIGMTEEEVMRYLNQVAFSSAQEFLEKYKGETNIIGHFGLGFYSAFMVAEKVEVVTQSWTGTPAVRWTCLGEPEYELESAERFGRGTDIILHLSADAEEFNSKQRIEELLTKYCKFLPQEIVFGTKTKYEEVETEELEEDGSPKMEERSYEVPNVINNTHPLWRKSPAEISEAEYKAFYNELYPYAAAPLFWIHLNIDYPFNLTGILYFPKVAANIAEHRNKIQLYSNQVYVTDEVKDIVPEFLTLLHGVIDSPDIPLNVSRSYLQSDANVKKISSYITKKVADRLEELFKKEREDYDSKWESIGLFVKYGFVTDEKFSERANKFTLLQSIDNKLYSLEEYREKVKDLQTDKNGGLVYLYTHDAEAHDAYIAGAKSYGYEVLKADLMIDNHFFQKLETGADRVTFKRVDADTLDKLIEKDLQRESNLTEDGKAQTERLFKEVVTDKGAQLEFQPLAPEEMPVVIVRPEFMRRMREMSSYQNMGFGDFPEMYQVVVNLNHPLVIEKIAQGNEQAGKATAEHLYNLARLHQNMLKGSELTAFIRKSMDLLG